MSSSSRGHPARTAAAAQDDGWEATRAQVGAATQVMHDDAHSPQLVQRDIGQAVSADVVELFVSCEPAEALLQQFDVLQPEFIAIHDLGCSVSRRLLTGVAQASQRRLQGLHIRRQGFGNTLARLEFVEWEVAGARKIRLYSTDVEADPAARHAIRLALLAHSRLGVVIVGDLPAQSMGSALEPLGAAMRERHWPNRELLMLPLSASTALATQAERMAKGTGVALRTTPQVTRPADAWSFISGGWNRLREQLGPAGRMLPPLPSVQGPATPVKPPAAETASAGAKATAIAPTERAAAMAPPVAAAASASPPAAAAAAVSAPAAPLARSTSSATSPSPGLGPTVAQAEPVVVPEFGNFPPRLPMQPMPKLPKDGPREQTLDELLGDYVGRLLKLNGMLAVCVFDRKTGAPRTHGGRDFTAQAMGEQARALMQASLNLGRHLSMPLAGPETAVTLGAHHVVLHPLPRHAELMLLAVLDKGLANLTLARLQIQRLDEDFSI